MCKGQGSWVPYRSFAVKAKRLSDSFHSGSPSPKGEEGRKGSHMLYHALFVDSQGRLWISREVGAPEYWAPADTGLSWACCGSRPWDNSQLRFVGLQNATRTDGETDPRFVSFLFRLAELVPFRFVSETFRFVSRFVSKRFPASLMLR